VWRFSSRICYTLAHLSWQNTMWIQILSRWKVIQKKCRWRCRSSRV
jgi:hypothetical protein